MVLRVQARPPLHTSYCLNTSRLGDIVRGLQDEVNGTGTAGGATGVSTSPLNKLHHITTPTLPHLIALLTRALDSFPPKDTSLIVVDAISALFALAFPKCAEGGRDAQASHKKTDTTQWASGRRWAIMGDVISKLDRLAVTKNIAILLICQSTTKVRSDTGAILHPAISGATWDGGVNNRIVLFRDWCFFKATRASGKGEQPQGMRFAGVMKVKGMAYDGNGLYEVPLDESENALRVSAFRPEATLKRKREQIADSEPDDGDTESDEEFGWGGAVDEALHTDGLP
ncbi:MAG: hypothetical protein Q9163_000490 [Psora crenata]